MKNYLEVRKEELKKRGNKGFTLMEMLIVVAIIAILIAIAIPVFTNQLNAAKDATDEANGRSIYGLAQAEYMLNNGSLPADFFSYDTATRVATVKASDGTTQTLTFSERTTGVTAAASGTSGSGTYVEVKSAGNGGDGWTFGTK